MLGLFAVLFAGHGGLKGMQGLVNMFGVGVRRLIGETLEQKRGLRQRQIQLLGTPGIPRSLANLGFNTLADPKMGSHNTIS